jgi:hypothetical protein
VPFKKELEDIDQELVTVFLPQDQDRGDEVYRLIYGGFYNHYRQRPPLNSFSIKATDPTHNVSVFFISEPRREANTWNFARRMALPLGLLLFIFLWIERVQKCQGVALTWN